MIWIFRADKASACSCEDDDDFFQYIQEVENLKLFEDHPNFGETNWSFILFTPQQASSLYSNKKTSDTQESNKKKFGFIQICQGDYQNPLEVLLTPELDIGALKKQWCLDYCKVHGYVVMESYSKTKKSESISPYAQSLLSCPTDNSYTTQSSPDFLQMAADTDLEIPYQAAS